LITDGDRYGNLGAKSSLCGKKVKITNPANKKVCPYRINLKLHLNKVPQSVTVTIADACPTCKNGNSIDLSEGAFKQIATLDQGMVGSTSFMFTID
jgi:expansin (peptidoglycan-binding protein)